MPWLHFTISAAQGEDLGVWGTCAVQHLFCMCLSQSQLHQERLTVKSDEGEVHRQHEPHAWEEEQ